VLPAGETMDLLVELTNPGRWMLHCHIAEHLGTGMMTVFQVEP
jgi:FtsP/CotA-like multicopper oxidase with cupredoxin domain